MATTTTHLVTAADGERVDFPGLGNRFVLPPDRAGGRLAIVEHTIAPRTLAGPMHVHEHEDEYSYVLAGRMGAQIGDEVIDAGPGELVVKPRGVPHAFWNAGDEETRVLEIITPGAFARYFAELAPVLAVEGEPDFAALAAIQARYGLTMDFDSIARLSEQHGLSA
jgi:mannose-6-phosphate isomerase-like protein (cupin superfamily)